MADLEVTKRAQPSEVSALSTFTYTVEVINHGPDIADGVTLTDTLPSEGITILGSQIDIGTCEGSSQIVCDLDELGVDETATLQVRVLAETMGTLTNEAAVSSTIADTNAENDYDNLEITVDPSADLVLTKTHQPETVYASTLFTYTLEVTNQGPYSATGIVLTDWLPPEVDLVDPGDCSGTDTVTCEKTDLLVGEHWEVTLVVRATQGVPLTNEASVWSETADPDPESNTVSYLTTIIPTADLDISKTASDGPVYLEEPLTYTVTITNLGPDPAEGVTLTDTLEGSFDLDILTASQGGCSETNPFICNLGDLLLGDSVTVTLVVTPTALGTITNTAVASSTTLDLIDGNNTNQVSDIVIPNADLSITKTSNADHVLVEDPITYTLTVTNHGPSIATDVSLVDTLPPGLTYTGHTPAEYDCTHDGSVTFSCNFPVMNPGESVQVTIHMFAPVDGAFTNSATVSSPVGESDLDNNTDSKETIVDPVAALEVAKTHKPSVIYAGQIILYEITVENSGPDDAEGVILTDDLPPGLDVDWVDPSQGQCTQDAPVECDLGTITTGTIVSVDIAARTDAAITLVNTVEVTTITADRDLENNEATDTTQVIPAADLSLTKTAEPVFVYTSNPLTYTLTVENLGPEPAVGVILTDTLPAGVTYQDLDISPGGGDDCDWSEVTNQVVCELGDIDEKDPTTTLTIWVTADEAGTLTNRAVVASSTYDTKMDNNTKTVDTEVYLPADLEVTQVGTPDTLNAQELLTYTITITNTGPAEATNATLVDDLDPLVAFESAPLGCTHVDQQVTCALGDLPEGGSTTLNITARTIITSTGGTISNTVTVSSDPWDPDTLDNTAVVTNTFLSDTQTPTGEWLLPVSYGEQWDVKGEIITLAITATDNIAIDYVKFYNIEHWDPNTPEDNVPRDVAILEEPPYELRFGTLSLAPGWNQMNLEVWDTAGNYFPDPSYDPRVYFIWLKFTPPEGYTKVYLPIALK